MVGSIETLLNKSMVFPRYKSEVLFFDHSSQLRQGKPLPIQT